MGEPTVHSESLTSVAIDGSRISVYTARAIVMMDPELAPAQKALMLQGLEAAGVCLDSVREVLPVEMTSLHVVQESGLIVPGR